MIQPVKEKIILGASARILEKPTIALSGGRISWLILARKADLRRLDSSAFAFAVIKSSAIFCRPVITREAVSYTHLDVYKRQR